METVMSSEQVTYYHFYNFPNKRNETSETLNNSIQGFKYQ